MEAIADGGWHAGAAVRIIGLAKTPQHNGKVGVISAKAGPEGRVGVELGKGKTMAVRRENLELVEAPQANGQALETGVAKSAVEVGAKATNEAARRESIVAQVAAARAAQAAAETAGGASEKMKPVSAKEKAGGAKTKDKAKASDQAFEAEAAAKVAVEAAKAAKAAMEVEAAAKAKVEAMEVMEAMAVAKTKAMAKVKAKAVAKAAAAEVEAKAKATKEAARREEVAAKVAAAQVAAQAAAQAATETVGGANEKLATETAGGAQDTPEYLVYAQYNEKAAAETAGGAKEKAGGATEKEKAKAKAAGSAVTSAPAAWVARAAPAPPPPQGKAEAAAAKAVAKVEAGAKAIKEAARREDYLGKTTLVGLPPLAPIKVAAAASREASEQALEPTVAATPAPTSPTSPGAAGEDFERAAAARARVVAKRASAVAESSPRRGSGGSGGTYAWPQLASSGPSWATILLGAAAQLGGTAAPAPAPSVPQREEPTWREMILNPSRPEPSSPTIADKLMVEEAHVRRTKRCDAVADVARHKANALVAVRHAAMCVRFVVRLQARTRGRRARLLAPAKAPRERTGAVAAHDGTRVDLAIASAEREARMASTAVRTKKRLLAKLLPAAANTSGEAQPPPLPPLLGCLARCLGASAKARA